MKQEQQSEGADIHDTVNPESSAQAVEELAAAEEAADLGADMEPSAAYKMLMATLRVMLKAVDARLVLEDGLGGDGRKIFNEYLGIFPVMLPTAIELEECKGLEMMWR